jgi:hypothetical protein
MDDTKPKRFPPFTAWAIVGPVLILGVGILIGLTAPPSDSDWFGAHVFVPVGIALLIACSVIAFARKERGALLSVTTALPALVLLLKVLAGGCI